MTSKRPARVPRVTKASTLPDSVPRPTALFPTPALRYWRLRRMLTQGELAEQANVPRSAIARLEASGVARPSTIRKLAAVLRVAPDDLRQSPPDD